MSIDLRLIEKYLQRAIDEFDTNPLAAKLMRKMLHAEPHLFCGVAIDHLNSNERSNAHRFVAVILARHEELFTRLTGPEIGTRESAIKLFKRFHEVDPSFDVRLAHKLPGCSYGNQACAFDSQHSTRALDILDETSPGRRLLPILGQLTESEDFRIAAKATLFVGRRVQSPAWSKRQLERKDQRIRANAVEALWGINSSPAIHLLEQCASDSNNRVVGNALVGLHIAAVAGAQQQVMALSRALKPQLRSTAAWVMGRVGTPSFKPRLTELIRDDQPQVRGTALRALISVRRTEIIAIEQIAAEAAQHHPEVIEKTIERALEDIHAPSLPGLPELRLDGSRFSSPLRR